MRAPVVPCVIGIMVPLCLKLHSEVAMWKLGNLKVVF